MKLGLTATGLLILICEWIKGNLYFMPGTRRIIQDKHTLNNDFSIEIFLSCTLTE